MRESCKRMRRVMLLELYKHLVQSSKIIQQRQYYVILQHNTIIIHFIRILIRFEVSKFIVKHHVTNTYNCTVERQQQSFTKSVEVGSALYCSLTEKRTTTVRRSESEP